MLYLVLPEFHVPGVLEAVAGGLNGGLGGGTIRGVAGLGLGGDFRLAAETDSGRMLTSISTANRTDTVRFANFIE